MPLISVVTPVFNAALFLDEMLQSLINQTFKDWECILINDGSTDDSLSIIKRYANLDSRIKFESNIKNSGNASIPREQAINYSTGEWIYNLDADDYIEKDTLFKLYKRCIQTNTDVILGRLVYFDANTRKKIYSIPNEDFDMDQILSGKVTCKLTFGGWKISTNGMLVRRELYSMTKSGPFINSDEYNYRIILLSSKNIAFCNAIDYCRVHSNSITNKKISTKRFESLYVDSLLLELVKSNYADDDKLIDLMYRTKINNILNYQREYIGLRSLFSKDDINTIRRTIKDNFNTLNINKTKQVITLRWKNLFLYNYNCFVAYSYIYPYYKKIVNMVK